VEQTRKSRKIDEMLAKDKRLIRKQVKLLLLGAGESGKSTFLKQMKIIHGQSLIDDNNTVDEYKQIIYQNIIKGMKVLIDARNKLGIDWGNDQNMSHANRVFNFDIKSSVNSQTFAQFVNSITELWNDKGIQMAFDRRIEFQLVFIPIIIISKFFIFIFLVYCKRSFFFGIHFSFIYLRIFSLNRNSFLSVYS